MKILEIETNGQGRETSLGEVLQRKGKGPFTSLQLPVGQMLLRGNDQNVHTVCKSNVASQPPLPTTNTKVRTEGK